MVRALVLGLLFVSGVASLEAPITRGVEPEEIENDQRRDDADAGGLTQLSDSPNANDQDSVANDEDKVQEQANEEPVAAPVAAKEEETEKPSVESDETEKMEVKKEDKNEDVMLPLSEVDTTSGIFWTLLLGASLVILARAAGLFAGGGSKRGEEGFSGRRDVDDSDVRGVHALRESGVEDELYRNAPDHLHLQAHSPQFNVPPNPYGGFMCPADNVETPWPFQNDACTGIFLPLHRPTYSKKKDASGVYPYAWHFHGRKRLWEMRIQLRFNREIENKRVRFGIELDEYVPIPRATAGMMKLTVGALRKVAGDQLYHSVGQGLGKEVRGERERPVFVMPLWAFDQFIVTPEGEEPPDLTSDISELGHLRTNGKAQYIKESLELKLTPGNVYTFSFWGISRFLDDLNWTVKNVVPMATVDFNKFCGSPPVHLVFYELIDREGEDRHVDSRKNYLFQLMFWSSKSPPKPQRLKQMLSSRGSIRTQTGSDSKKGFSLFQCCTSR